MLAIPDVIKAEPGLAQGTDSAASESESPEVLNRKKVLSCFEGHSSIVHLFGGKDQLSTADGIKQFCEMLEKTLPCLQDCRCPYLAK